MTGEGRDKLAEALNRHFGYRGFRPGQREIISRLIEGRNVLGLLSTGGGKSLTYQLTSLLMPGLTIVVSPLISLMIDQVQKLRMNGRRDVVYLNSSLPAEEMRRVLAEMMDVRCKLLYMSPEKLRQPGIVERLKRRGVSLVAVDEAHCISQWGHDFRTDYLRLPEVIAQLGHPPVLALTATATQAVREEVCQLFAIMPEDVVMQTLNRPNIAYEVLPVASEKERQDMLLRLLGGLGGPGIVYCATRQSVEELVWACRRAGMKRIGGYHGGMEAMDRLLVQEQFLRNELRVIVATNAFGMGIDKADIRFVLHYHFPSSLEAYVQETGRIGRDGQPGYAGLLYLPEDELMHRRMLTGEIPGEEELRKFVQVIGQVERAGTVSYVDLYHALGVGENTCRALFFYAEKTGMVRKVAQTADGFHYQAGNRDVKQGMLEMAEHLQRTVNGKLRKLVDMRNLLEREGCLRQGIGRYFGEEAVSQAGQVCCSRCGFSRQPFMRPDGQEKREETAKWELKRALEKLLPAPDPGGYPL